jgi:hypothetical protein
MRYDDNSSNTDNFSFPLFVFHPTITSTSPIVSLKRPSTNLRVDVVGLIRVFIGFTAECLTTLTEAPESTIALTTPIPEIITSMIGRWPNGYQVPPAAADFGLLHRSTQLGILDGHLRFTQDQNEVGTNNGQLLSEVSETVTKRLLLKVLYVRYFVTAAIENRLIPRSGAKRTCWIKFNDDFELFSVVTKTKSPSPSTNSVDSTNRLRSGFNRGKRFEHSTLTAHVYCSTGVGKPVQVGSSCKGNSLMSERSSTFSDFSLRLSFFLSNTIGFDLHDLGL